MPPCTQSVGMRLNRRGHWNRLPRFTFHYFPIWQVVLPGANGLDYIQPRAFTDDDDWALDRHLSSSLLHAKVSGQTAIFYHSPAFGHFVGPHQSSSIVGVQRQASLPTVISAKCHQRHWCHLRPNWRLYCLWRPLHRKRRNRQSRLPRRFSPGIRVQHALSVRLQTYRHIGNQPHSADADHGSFKWNGHFYSH